MDVFAAVSICTLVLVLVITIGALIELRDKEIKTRIRQQHKIGELTNELRYWIVQKGCDCDHPACSTCKDVKDAYKLINSAHPFALYKGEVDERT